MKRVWPIILAAVALLVMLEVVGELAGKPLGFPYSPLGVVSVLIYLGVGAIGAWRANFERGLLAAGLVGLVSGTFGPLVAWLMEAGPIAQEATELRIFAYRIAVVTAIATAAGLIGAAAGSWLERRRGLRGSRVVPR
jgi:hypothetical protein